MIKSLYTIGKVLKQDEDFEEYFEPWANPFPRVGSGDAIVVCAEVKDGKLISELKQEDFKSQFIEGYLYRKVNGANGTNLVPTLLFQVESNEAKYQDNVRKLCKKIRQSINNQKHTFLDVKKVDSLEEMLLDYHGSLSFAKRHLFTFKVDGKYFGDFPENKKLFMDDAYQKYYKGSLASNKLCSVTNEIADEVWGRVDTLGFTVNDVAFSRNGFNDGDSYKMFPVSPEAVKILEGTKRIIINSEKSLTRNFYGMKYFVLPRFIFEDKELIKDTMNFFFRERPANESMKEVGESLINGEQYLKEIAEEPNQFKGVYFDLFFFEPNNAQFMIKLHLSDVLPSRIVNIFKAKAAVEKRYEKLNRIKINSKAQGEEKTIWNYHITFGGLLEKKMPPMYGIKDYFSEKVKTNTVFHPIFFEILEAVFQNQKLNRISVLTAFMHKITMAFKNIHEYPEDLDRHVKATFTIYQFFNELQLFNPTVMEEKPTQELELTEEGLLTPDNFVSSHANYFTENEPAKKGAFYLGCMTAKMMEMQRKYYDMESNYSAPIAKHLQSLNFGEQDLRKLFSKLEDYKKYSSRMTTESGRNKLTKFDFDDIEVLQLQAGMNMTNISDLPRVELSYAFTLGMTIQRESTKAAIAKGSKEKKIREAQEKQQSTK